MGGERELMGDHAHSMGEREIMGDHAQTMGVCPQRRTRVQVAAHGAQSERARATGHGSLQVTGHASLGTGHWSRGAAALGAITAGFDSKKRRSMLPRGMCAAAAASRRACSTSDETLRSVYASTSELRLAAAAASSSVASPLHICASPPPPLALPPRLPPAAMPLPSEGAASARHAQMIGWSMRL